MKKLSTLAIVLVISSGLAIGCGDDKKASVEKSKSMIVVFASSDPKIIRSGQQVVAQIGTVVREGDTIKTENGKLDLQTRDGSAIRVGKFTTITVAKLFAGNTTLQMKHGQVLASVKRASKNQKFAVVTPTAIAGVRGTTFKVDMLDETQPPKVKVMDGKVAMSARIKVLEKYSKADIEKNASLKKLAALQKKSEVVLDGKTEGVLDKKLNDQVKKANNATDKSKSTDAAVVVKLAAVKKITADLEKKKAVQKKKSAVTVQEMQETSTLVAVDTKTFDKIASGTKTTTAPADTAKAIASLKKTHEAKRAAKQETVLKRIEEQATKRKLNSEKEIRAQYSKLELVILRNGQKIRGAVIASTSSVLVIHTKAGVKRVPRSKVSSQEFLQ